MLIKCKGYFATETDEKLADLGLPTNEAEGQWLDIIIDSDHINRYNSTIGEDGSSNIYYIDGSVLTINMSIDELWRVLKGVHDNWEHS